jgi:ligand-binding sensor domain-containing protein/signal transduction histidine kinase
MKRLCHAFAFLFWWIILLAPGLTDQFSFASTNLISRYSVRIWQTDDGLPQNSVYAVAQTLDGYLWVGTHEGLARFDGIRFDIFDDPAAPELRRGWITALCTTKDGSLLIAVDRHGLVRIKNRTVTHISETDGLVSNQTRCLLEDKDGSLWIGTEGGLSHYKDGKFANFTTKHGLGDSSIRALCQDRQGAIRTATLRGLSSVDTEGNISTLNFGLGTFGNALKSVWQDKSGDIWVTSNEGATCVQPQRQLPFGMAEGLPDKLATAIYEDRSARIWIGTYNGLACVAGGKVLARPMNEAGFGDLIYAIFEDAEENLWVGGRDGLYRLRPARFTAYTTQEGLSCNNAMSVFQDNSGSVWIATWGGGLNELKDNKFIAYGTTNGLTRDAVLSLLQTRDGSIWAGMDFDGGLNCLKRERTNVFPYPSGLTNAVRVICEDKQGTLWVGTSRGLDVMNPATSQNHTRLKGLPGNMVMAICEDWQGKIWVGTDGGLSRWEGKKFTNFNTQNGLSHNSVDAIYEDKDHVLWLGTKGGGLNCFKQGKFSAYTTKQGLFSDEIYEILEDDFGYFWMSCRNGIFRIRKQEFTDLDNGNTRLLTCTAFGKADGLASVQCNGVAKPSGWKDREGRLWFPTIRGVVAVECRIKTNDKPPPVLIEQVIADKKPLHSQFSRISLGRSPSMISENKTFEIPPGRGELEIHYTALSLQAPDKNRFKYKLEGIDSDWVEAGTRRMAHYNNVSPGTHTFRVLGCNNDGVWNETGATLGFLFLPHFWQTWFFKASLSLALALVLVGLYRIRVSRLREIERLRVQIAADLHDDVGARLTKVAMVTEWMDRETSNTDRAKPHIQNIAGTTREIIRAMDEIVWTINPNNDTLDNLANYIFQYAQEYFQHTNVRCRLDLPARLPNYDISTEARHNLFMVVKEALNNVLKHSLATEVRISLSVTESKLLIIITDNGRGFAPARVNGSGDGLKNMKQRVERIGGRLFLESSPGNGTLIKVEANAG